MDFHESKLETDFSGSHSWKVIHKGDYLPRVPVRNMTIGEAMLAPGVFRNSEQLRNSAHLRTRFVLNMAGWVSSGSKLTFMMRLKQKRDEMTTTSSTLRTLTRFGIHVLRREEKGPPRSSAESHQSLWPETHTHKRSQLIIYEEKSPTTAAHLESKKTFEQLKKCAEYLTSCNLTIPGLDGCQKWKIGWLGSERCWISTGLHETEGTRHVPISSTVLNKLMDNLSSVWDGDDDVLLDPQIATFHINAWLCRSSTVDH